MQQARVAVFLHYVWATWDRLPLLTGEVEQVVYRAIGAKCSELGAALIALGGTDDHVHLLVSPPTTVTIADLVGQIKGASAHLATHERAPGEFFKWQGGYGVFSVSPRYVQQVCDYINQQREHHRLGKVYRALEPGDGARGRRRPKG